MTSILKNIRDKSVEYIDEIMSILNSKEQEVILKRNGIDKPYRMTLQAIGEDMYITRERVRQIEKKAISKIARNLKAFQVNEIVQLVEANLISQGSIVTEKEFCKILDKHGLETEFIGIIYLALQISNNIGYIKKSIKTEKSIYDKLTLTESQVKNVITETINILSKENRTLDIEEITARISKVEKVNQKQITKILDITNNVKYLEGVYGLSTWRNVNPKSIKDKAVIILKRAHRPLHFRTINKLIHENKFDHKTVTVEAVHNELIRYEDFVLVGRGLYALQSWGYSKGTVKDVIYEILKENGPLKKKEIVEKVLEKRQVKIGTISLNLQKNPEFKRVGRAIYSI